MYMSHIAIWLSTLFRLAVIDICIRIPVIVPSSLAFINPSSETLTPITMSAPISKSSSTGKLSTTPPSTASVVSRSAAVKAVGIDMLALRASERDPSLKTIGSPVLTSVAIHLNGMGKSSKDSYFIEGHV